MNNPIQIIPTKLLIILLITFSHLSVAASELPIGSSPAPIDTSHFPSKLHTVVWRNWELVPHEQIAATVNATPEQITALAKSMGLPPQRNISPDTMERGYISIIRRNWHLLPYDQLLTMLDLTAEQLATRLREDDFLFIKLGSLKPDCKPVIYAPPSPTEASHAQDIRRLVKKEFGDTLANPGESPFAFLKEFKQPTPDASPPPTTGSLRFIYSYFAPFGDPLLDATLDPYPDALLAQLQQQGVNGVWLHTVLRDLAPATTDFPEFGKDSQTRLRNLRQLTKRCARYGIRVYLYVNEPRAMPAAFFQNRPDMKGVSHGDYHSMCTSDPTVLSWISDSLANVFAEAPDLGGVFTITASENPTNCASHFRHTECPRCSKRTPAEIMAEVNTAIRDGVRRSSPDARVICYDWGWNRHGDATDYIAALPAGVDVMSVSEWSIPLTRGGTTTTVGEYSISTVGPGPRASRHWKLAKSRGLGTIAKVQFNNSWEMSSVPWLPVADLVASHSLNLTNAGIDGLMLSWSLGGYPSPNLQLAQVILDSPGITTTTALDRVATARYGSAAAPHVRQAWTAFSKAFTKFPYHATVLYNGPQQLGPANPLYPEPTGYKATMVGFPYDDLERWRGPYPADTWIQQFDDLCAGWQTALLHYNKALENCTTATRETLEADIRLAEAAGIHFASCANQARYIIARDKKDNNIMKEAIAKEITLAKRLYHLAKKDSRIGFEASNHYYYVPLDLVEKVINCHRITQHTNSQLETHKKNAAD